MSSSPRSPSLAPVLWCLVSAMLFGASTPASKHLLAAFGPLTLSGLLYAGAAIAVAPWAARAPRPAWHDRRSLVRLVGAIVFGGVLGPVLVLQALRSSSAASVALWLNLETPATALLGWWAFKEHLTRRTLVSIALVIVASLLLSPGTPGAGVSLALVALACLAWGLDNNLTSLVDGYSPAQITFAKGCVAGSVNLSLGMLVEPHTVFDMTTLGTALAVGAVGYGASLLLYVASAQQLGATRSQLIFSSAPLFGLVLAWAALGETLRTAHLLATGLMAMSLWLWHRERHAHRHAHEAIVHRHWHRHDDDHHDHHSASVPAWTWHSHEHVHRPLEHVHAHRPDLHHRHEH